MQDSGVEWLGNLPAHWSICRADRLLAETKRTADPQSLAEQNVFHYSIPNVQQYGGGSVERSSAIESSKTVVDRELLLVSKLNPRMGTIALARPDESLVTLASGEFVAMEPHGVNGEFAQLVYATEGVRSELSSRVASATKSHQRCAPEDISKLTIPLPTPDEQTAIVRFLNHADDHIQRYVRAKEKLIALLQEHKQAVIHQVVTGQIDVRTGECYPAYRDSCVEWLGEVPQHWDVRRLGQIGTFSKGSGGNKDDEVPEGVPCIRYGDLYTMHKYFIRSSRSCVPSARATDYTLIRFGDLLFAGSGETMGEIGKSAVNLIRSEVRCGGDIIVFRANREVEPEFLGYATDAPSAVAQKATMGRGFTVMHIYAKQLKRLALTLPPLAEQVEIARFLDDALARIDAGMVVAARQIKLARELRSSLTADVVTGKLDVREAANALPEHHLTQYATSVHANP